jgi:DNA-binding HxlR family transcriptional regulator
MNLLPSLFHHKWAMPVLAEFHAKGGGRFVALARVLGASQGAIRQTLEFLVLQGWVKKDEMYGHPLRPEYLLTEKGRMLAKACAELHELLGEVELDGLAESKWATALVLGAAKGPVRFSELRAGFPDATDRALSQALKLCLASGAMTRTVDTESRPPTPWYGLTSKGSVAAVSLGKLDAALIALK